MEFSLIICTYMRPKAILELLDSVEKQTLYPDEIIIVDGSTDLSTQKNIQNRAYKNLDYYLVEDNNRGLTRQRNYGIDKSSKEIVCFLDDDIVLTDSYFEELISTYSKYPEAMGVGGYIIEETEWKQLTQNSSKNFSDYEYDGYIRPLGSRNILRKKLGLLSDKPPGIMPEFSNGFSVSFLPPSNKIYRVEYFMGGVSSFKRVLFDTLQFSTYFEGYGLYEDADFCLRASKLGDLYVNTTARLYHYHDASGRPNKYYYGKMVIRNGWYVWRIKYPKPAFFAKLKWHAIAFLLTLVRFTNVITTPKKKEAFTEAMGRAAGWFSLFFNRPKQTI